MSVVKRSHLISDFRHRIDLLYKKIIENHDGEMEETHQKIGSAWAKIKPISGFTRNGADLWHLLETQKIDGMFKIIMRNSDGRIAKNTCLNALSWNHKILDILIPFQIYENGKWTEGIAVDYRRGSRNG